MSAPEQNDEKVIGLCQGCLKTAVLTMFACATCRENYGEMCGLLFHRIRSDTEFACQFWSCLTPGKKAGFVRIFGDPGARVVREESEKLLGQACNEERWTPELALRRLESHVCVVLARRRSDPEDLLRAASMLRAIWRELTPERWQVLLRAVQLHSSPELLERLSRCVPEGSAKSLNREQVLTDLFGALDRARAHRMPARGGALLLLAQRLGEACRMKPEHLSWAVRHAPEAAPCLAEWAVAHAEATSFARLAESAAATDDRRSIRRCLAWTALWLEPRPARWQRYAEQCTLTSEQAEARSGASIMNERLASWAALVVRSLPDGPARMVSEQREGARQALTRALRLEPDAFVRAVLELWAARDSSGSWSEEGRVDDGI